MQRQFFVTDALEFNPDPTADANVGWAVEFLRRLFDKHFLNTDCRWNRHCDMSVVVMIVGKHCEHFFAYKPGWFTVRDFFPRFGKRETNAANPFNVFDSRVSLLRFCYLFYLLMNQGSNVCISD